MSAAFPRYYARDYLRAARHPSAPARPGRRLLAGSLRRLVLFVASLPCCLASATVPAAEYRTAAAQVPTVYRQAYRPWYATRMYRPWYTYHAYRPWYQYAAYRPWYTYGTFFPGGVAGVPVSASPLPMGPIPQVPFPLDPEQLATVPGPWAPQDGGWPETSVLEPSAIVPPAVIDPPEIDALDRNGTAAGKLLPRAIAEPALVPWNGACGPAAVLAPGEGPGLGFPRVIWDRPWTSSGARFRSGTVIESAWAPAVVLGRPFAPPPHATPTPFSIPALPGTPTRVFSPAASGIRSW